MTCSHTVFILSITINGPEHVCRLYNYIQKSNFANAERRYKEREGIPSQASMNMEYLKYMYRANPNFEVNFGLNVAIGKVATRWDI